MAVGGRGVRQRGEGDAGGSEVEVSASMKNGEGEMTVAVQRRW